MRLTPFLAAAISLPALAQDYELRLERFNPHLQALPQVPILFGQPAATTGWTRQEGKSLSIAFLLTELTPEADFRLRLEHGSAQGDGFVDEPGKHTAVHIDHKGLGIGLGWVVSHRPSGFGAEAELLERFWSYTLRSSVQTNSERTMQTWARLGVRWTLPVGKVRPFLTVASEWVLIGRNTPDSASPKGTTRLYLKDQQASQHTVRNQCFGIGVMF